MQRRNSSTKLSLPWLLGSCWQRQFCFTAPAPADDVRRRRPSRARRPAGSRGLVCERRIGRAPASESRKRNPQAPAPQARASAPLAPAPQASQARQRRRRRKQASTSPSRPAPHRHQPSPSTPRRPRRRWARATLYAGSAAEPCRPHRNQLQPPAAPGETTKAPAETTKAPGETTKAPTETTKAPAETTKAPAETTKAPTETTSARTDSPPPPPVLPPRPACTKTLSSSSGLASALSSASAGSAVCLSAGNYSTLTLENINPAGNVTLEPAEGASVTIAGINVKLDSNLTIRGFHFSHGVYVTEGASHVTFEENLTSNTECGYFIYGSEGHEVSYMQLLDNTMEYLNFTRQGRNLLGCGCRDVRQRQALHGGRQHLRPAYRLALHPGARHQRAGGE